MTAAAAHLLEPTPEPVAVEQRRLRAYEGRERTQPAGFDHPGRELVEGERKQSGNNGQERLVEPHRVATNELAADADRHDRAHRIALRKVRLQGCKVGGRLAEPRQAPPVLHRPVEIGEKRRIVVELEVPGERGAAGEDDGGGVYSEGSESGGERPEVHARKAAATDGEPEPGYGRGDHGRRREPRCGLGHDREQAHDHEDAETAGNDQCSRETEPGGPLQQKPATERERDYDQREGGPGDEERRHFSGSRPSEITGPRSGKSVRPRQTSRPRRSFRI